MKITGKFLKENREKKGISIGEVALATKINNRTIIALEEGDVDNLPPKTFLRGFVRSYASYLELDVEHVLNTFYEEMGTTKPKSSSPADAAATSGPMAPTSLTPRNRSATPEADQAINPRTSLGVKIGAVAGILLLVLLIVFFKNKMESYERESQKGDVPPLEALNSSTPSGSPTATAAVNASPTPSDSATPAAEIKNETASPSPAPATSSAAVATVTKASPAATAAPTATPTSILTATPTATPTATFTATSAAIAKPSPSPSAAPKPTASPKPAASGTPSPTPKPSPSAAASQTPTPTPTPKPTATAKPTSTPETKTNSNAVMDETLNPLPTPKPARSQEVIIEAMDSVDVDLQVDGEANKKIHLKTDQVQSIKAKRKVVMKFSDGGAVNVIVNGTDRGVPGDLGKPARLEIP